ncbi:hypothetical protein STEG23_034792, partial [Scotinomys teguina]
FQGIWSYAEILDRFELFGAKLKHKNFHYQSRGEQHNIAVNSVLCPDNPDSLS